VVKDRTGGDKEFGTEWSATFNLDETLDLKIHPDYPNAIYSRLENADLTLWIQEIGSRTTMSHVFGQDSPYRGWRSIKDREFTPCWSLRFSQAGMQAEFTTIFSFGDHPLEVKAITDDLLVRGLEL
jgi:hypothetical protein